MPDSDGRIPASRSSTKSFTRILCSADVGNAAAPAGGSADVRPLSEAELRELDRPALLRHALNLQRAQEKLESDNGVLAWEIREMTENLAFFSRVAELAHRMNDADVAVVAALAVAELPLEFNCRFAALYFYDPQTGLFSVSRSTVPCPEGEPLHIVRDSGHFLVRFFTRRQEPFMAEFDLEHEAAVADNDTEIFTFTSKEWRAILGRTAVVIPLWAKAADGDGYDVLGGLIVGDAECDLTGKDAEKASVFSDLFSSGLHNAMLVRRLNEMSTIDPLTQLFNRRHLVDQLASAMAQARRHGSALSILMLDIDRFKNLNDTHGHVCGDEVLRAVGGILKASCRAGDVPARYGGEEFMLVLPSTDRAAALEAAERVRARVGEGVVECDGASLSVTCSIGLAQYDPGESLERFIARADAALYRAKVAGRNRVAADGEG